MPLLQWYVIIYFKYTYRNDILRSRSYYFTPPSSRDFSQSSGCRIIFPLNILHTLLLRLKYSSRFCEQLGEFAHPLFFSVTAQLYDSSGDLLIPRRACKLNARFTLFLFSPRTHSSTLELRLSASDSSVQMPGFCGLHLVNTSNVINESSKLDDLTSNGDL